MRKRYEIVIVICCFFSLFVNVGLPSTSFAVYQPSIVAVPGVGDTGGSAILAVRVLMSLVVLTVVDRYYDALDTRRGLALSMALTAAGFFVFMTAHSLALFIVGAVLCGAAYGLGGMIATTMLVNRWFKGAIGTAVGVASVGSGVAGTVMPIVASQIIHRAGLSAAFGFAAVLAAVLAVLVFAFLRNRPSEMGLQPYEPAQKERAGRSGARVHPAYGNVSLSPAGRHLLFAAVMMVGAFCMASVAYLSVLLQGQGFNAHLAAVLVSVTGLCLTVAKFVVGRLFDRVGTPVASGIMFAILTVGFALLCAAGGLGTVAAVAGAACMGCGVSLGTVGVSVWSLQLSSPEMRQKSIKSCQLAFAAGGFVMNLLPGPLKALTGSYVTSYVLMLACGIGAAVIVLCIYRRVSRRS